MAEFFMKYWWLTASLAVLFFFILIISLISSAGKLRALKAKNADLGKKLADSHARSEKTVELPKKSRSQPEETPSNTYKRTAVVEIDEGEEDYEDEEEDEDDGDESIVFTVVFDRPKNTWVVKKSGNERVTRRVATKAEAMNIVRDLCRKYGATMSIHKKDGKFQKH